MKTTESGSLGGKAWTGCQREVRKQPQDARTARSPGSTETHLPEGKVRPERGRGRSEAQPAVSSGEGT